MGVVGVVGGFPSAVKTGNAVQVKSVRQKTQHGIHSRQTTPQKGTNKKRVKEVYFTVPV